MHSVASPNLLVSSPFVHDSISDGHRTQGGRSFGAAEIFRSHLQPQSPAGARRVQLPGPGRGRIDQQESATRRSDEDPDSKVLQTVGEYYSRHHATGRPGKEPSECDCVWDSGDREDGVQKLLHLVPGPKT